MAADLQHTFGADLTLSAVGGLAIASGTQHGQEKVTRRLLTNPGDDLMQPDYGAGLPASIGNPSSAARIRATILKQLRLERNVSQTIGPKVHVDLNASGVAAATVQYVDAGTGQNSILIVPFRNA